MGKAIQDYAKAEPKCRLAPSGEMRANRAINVTTQAPEICRARNVYTIAVCFPAGAYQFSVHKTIAKIGARQTP